MRKSGQYKERTRKYMNLVLLFKLIVLFSLVESTGQNNNNNYNDKLANDCLNCNIYLLLVAIDAFRDLHFAVD